MKIKTREQINDVIETLGKDYEVKNAEVEVVIDKHIKLKVVLK